jgi:molybdate transport system substrate-binding protein
MSRPGAGDEGRARAQFAVASNFVGVARTLAERFEQSTGSRVVVAAGSTGKHYAQIVNGAPFDGFLAADGERPRRLERAGLAVGGSRFTYAKGRLVLWSPREGLVSGGESVLAGGGFRHLAMADPTLAPYGAAAKEVMESLGVWAAVEGKVVRGANVGQAFAFVHSGSADLGFVAASQVVQGGARVSGSAWFVPESMHRPIDQQAVLLTENPTARAFMEYLRSGEARELIRGYGLSTP